MDNIKEILKDAVSIEDVANVLGVTDGLKRHGNILQGNCFTGHESKGQNCFTIVCDRNFFNCYHCHIAGDIFALVMARLGLNKEDKASFPLAIKWVCEKFRPDLLQHLENSASFKQTSYRQDSQDYYRNCNFFDALVKQGKELLYTSQDAKECLEYLTISRRYDIDILKKTEWFYLPKSKDAKDWLKSQFPEQESAIESKDETSQKFLLSLNGAMGDDFSRLAFPYRDRQGNITGFIKRHPTKAGLDTIQDGKIVNHRYDSTIGLKKHDIFGLHNCKGQKDLIIVEGYPDCMYFQALGMKNIVALGKGILSDSHVDSLLSFGIKSVTFALDNDSVGSPNTAKAIERIQKKSENKISCFVIPPSLYGTCKDPDELYREKGIQAFYDCTRQAVFASRWLAENLLKGKKLSLDKERKECFDGLLSLYGTFPSVTDKEAIKEIMQQSFDETEIKIFLEETERKQAQEKKSQEARQAIEKRNQDVKMLLGKMEQEQQENNGVTDILSYAESLKAIENEYQKTTARAKQSQSQWLDGLFQKEKENEGKELLGYALGKDFFPIQKDLEGIQPGLYILGAQTNIGKTAFVANLAIHLLENNTGLKVLYFSLDDNKDIIATRFRAILAFSSRDFSNRQAYESQNITINEFRKPLDTWKSQKRSQTNAKLRLFAESESLFVYDIADTPSIADIELIIRRMANEKIAVIIDGLYNASVGESQGKREENIERANKIKALVDSYSIPLVCTAEVRKRSNQSKETITIDDLMETGKFGYNANLVWLLYKQGQDDDNNEMLTLTLDYAKNKLSGFKGKQEIQYFRKYAKMFVEWARKEQKGITQESFDAQGTEKNKGRGKK